MNQQPPPVGPGATPPGRAERTLRGMARTETARP
jgi:hypothetical protein